MIDVLLLRYKTPFSLRMFLVFAGLMWLPGPVVILMTRPELFWETFRISSVGAVILIFIYLNKAGYRVGYDDTRLYMRGFGIDYRRLRWPVFHSIAFDDIALIEPRTQTGTPSGSRYVPGEYLAIESIRPEDEEVWIYPDALHEAEMIPLLLHLAEQRFDLMPQVILDRLAADGLMKHA